LVAWVACLDRNGEHIGYCSVVPRPIARNRPVSYDLHTHTTFSDGTTTPTQNVVWAAAAGLRGLAVTDHDTTAGWQEARAACARHSVDFVPGVELSTELGGRGIHILGYWIDPAHPALARELERLRSERRRRAGEILRRLGELGVVVPPERVAAHAGGAPIGRPHIAAALVEAGVVADLQAAFDEFLADGGPAYVAKHAVSPVEGVRLVHAAGGVAVLAHPGVSGRDAPVTAGLVDELVAVGLAGIEVDHPGHDEATAAEWRGVAMARELVVTGASDYHGTNKSARIGEASTPLPALERLRERAGAAEGVSARERSASRFEGGG
jgi:predicted metal-dependent phosphoesterase TrpH